MTDKTPKPLIDIETLAKIFREVGRELSEGKIYAFPLFWGESASMSNRPLMSEQQKEIKEDIKQILASSNTNQIPEGFLSEQFVLKSALILSDSTEEDIEKIVKTFGKGPITIELAQPSDQSDSDLFAGSLEEIQERTKQTIEKALKKDIKPNK